ncbi:phenylacetate-CoA oxygenase subunit PaaC [Flavobacteriales bacterium]|jgi:ring-1,2-phenylacetyl-CoA epoxidase subunit PaaC|nr:phenylacetate-CoA oxygenase subunit PaaC [Flavobacteriales bacterium]
MMEIKDALFEYCLRIGDNSLVLGHRVSEWCGHGPILEEDIALTNIALDLVGQSRTLLTYAGDIEGKGRTEDDLAYLRQVVDYRNCLLAEQENGDFARTIVRQFLFDSYNALFLEELQNSADETLAAYATKSLKEAAYHVRHSSEWMIRLGDGTAESKKRTQAALDELWMYSGELFEMDETEKTLQKANIAPDSKAIYEKWTANVSKILEMATLQLPETGWMQSGGRTGKHSELLGYVLAELQYVQRSYPNCEW